MASLTWRSVRRLYQSILLGNLGLHILGFLELKEQVSVYMCAGLSLLSCAQAETAKGAAEMANLVYKIGGSDSCMAVLSFPLLCPSGF